jgi:uncharacterized protein YggE
MARGFTSLLRGAVGVCVVLLLSAVPAVAAQTGTVTATNTVTATGTGQTRVLPKDRHSNASIATAFEAARKASITGAIGNAHEYALDYAHAVGLKLGTVVSVSDQSTSGFYGYGPGGFLGPFGPGQFCGIERQPIFKQVNGHRKVVGTKKVHRCIVPKFAYTTLTVTYSAT